MSVRRMCRLSMALFCLFMAVSPAIAEKGLPAAAEAGRAMPVLPVIERASLAAIVLGNRAIIKDSDEGSPFVPRRNAGARSRFDNGRQAMSGAKETALDRTQPVATTTSQVSQTTFRNVQNTNFSFNKRATSGSPVDFTSVLNTGLRVRGKAVSRSDATDNFGTTGNITFETVPEAISRRGVGFSGTFARQINGGSLSEALSVKLNASPAGALKLNSEFSSKGANGYYDESTASIGFETSQAWKKRSRFGLAGGFSHHEKGASSVSTANLRFDANPIKGFILKGDFQNRGGSVEERTSRIGFETLPEMRKVANFYLSGNFTHQDNAQLQNGKMNLKVEFSPFKAISFKGEINDEQSNAGISKRESKLAATTSMLKYLNLSGNYRMLEQSSNVDERLINIDFKSNNKLINWKSLAISGKYTVKEQGSNENKMLNLQASLKPLKRMTLIAGIASGKTAGNPEETRTLKLGYSLPHLGYFHADAVMADRYTGDTANGSLRFNMTPWQNTKVNLQYTVKPHFWGSDPLTTAAMDFSTGLSKTFSLYGGLKKDEISNDSFMKETLLGIKAILSSRFNLAGDYRLQDIDGGNQTIIRGMHIQDSIHKRVTLLFGLEQAIRTESTAIGSYVGLASNPFGKVNISYKHRMNTGNGTLANLPKEEFKVSAPMAKTTNKNLEINGNIYYVDQEISSNNKLKAGLNLSYRPIEKLNLTASYKADVIAKEIRTAPELIWEAVYGTEF